MYHIGRTFRYFNFNKEDSMIINLTGIDGCGKGTQKVLLSQKFKSEGKRVFLSKAYGDAEKETFSPFIQWWHQTSILFLFQALHTQQRFEALEAEEKGDIVISDRWDDSYHAYHRNFGILADDPELRAELNKIAFDGRSPDITFLLDVPLEVAQNRMDVRGRDFFDKHPLSYHKAMLDEYHALAGERGWIIINAEKPVGEIHKDIVSHLTF